MESVKLWMKFNRRPGMDGRTIAMTAILSFIKSKTNLIAQTIFRPFDFSGYFDFKWVGWLALLIMTKVFDWRMHDALSKWQEANMKILLIRGAIVNIHYFPLSQFSFPLLFWLFESTNMPSNNLNYIKFLMKYSNKYSRILTKQWSIVVLNSFLFCLHSVFVWKFFILIFKSVGRAQSWEAHGAQLSGAECIGKLLSFALRRWNKFGVSWKLVGSQLVSTTAALLLMR